MVLGACVTTEQLRNQYIDKSGTKAFALASNGPSGASWGQATYRDAIQLAMYYCRKGGGLNCRIVDLDGRPFQARPLGYVIGEVRKREYRCDDITLGQAYSYLQQGHYYLDLDGDGHPCEWGTIVNRWTPVPSNRVSSSGSNCHWVKGYTRKDGTRVSGHRRCR